ncbi:TPA: hypothetical protein MAZ80_003900 [Klebsiella pneumoniae]|nr:hypothetical protein [Klebsiella pneumoniae]HCD1380158.1 hypothetical protein [Klebsiella pneumoniae subsp. pneumoniae]HCD1392753.1 hypothetical protein [Klebsiella pneumoniae subsp. pneumoniae]
MDTSNLSPEDANFVSQSGFSEARADDYSSSKIANFIDSSLMGLLVVLIIAAICVRLYARRHLLMNKLNTPTKRAGIIVFFVGFAIAFSSVLAADLLRRGDFLWNLWRFVSDAVVFHYSYRNVESKLFFAAGFYLMIIGFLFSYLYDLTVGKLINWIRNGNKN